MIVGIIGAGTMGSGIAHAFAQCEGFEVRLCDITGDIAARGKGRIENQLKKRVLKGKMDEADARAIWIGSPSERTTSARTATSLWKPPLKTWT